MNIEDLRQGTPAELSLSPGGRVYFNYDRQPSERLLPDEYSKIQGLFAKDAAWALIFMRWILKLSQ